MKRQTEIIFIVEEDASGGYTAKAAGYPIFTEADSIDELKDKIRDALRCHFDDESDIIKEAILKLNYFTGK